MLPALNYRPPMGAPVIVYRDDDILLVDKPAGLLSVPGKALAHADCLETRVKTAAEGALLVHRLDLDTSGIMVFAMNKKAQRHLGLQFERRHIEKTYLAVVAGAMTDDEGRIDLPLIVDWPNRPLQKVDFETGRQALTHWAVVDRHNDRSTVRLRPKTGRSHQLRVHMKEIGHPILGDRFYASGYALGAADRLMLHAESLELFHPTGGARVRFQSVCPF